MPLTCLRGILHHNCFNLGCYSCPVRVSSKSVRGFLSRGPALQQTKFSNETGVTCIFHLGVRGAVRQDLDVNCSALE